MRHTLQLNLLDHPLYVMAKPIGSRCNLVCGYCYYLEKEVNNSVTGMSDETLERFIRLYIEAQPTSEICFTWHGGEPLLKGVDFYCKVLRFQQQYARNRTILNSIQTNGLLLNDHWCRFFKEHNFLVGISIDGPQHVHDQYRVDPKGRGSFQSVMRAIELLHRYGIEFNTLSVITDYAAQYPLEIYGFLKQIGSGFMQFSPVVERVGERVDGLRLLSVQDKQGRVTSHTVDPIAYGDFYISVFDHWVRYDVSDVFVQLFDATLAKYVGVPAGVCLYEKTCGHAMALEQNGNLYACDHFVFPEYCRGNIHTHSITEMILSNQQKRFGQDKYATLPMICMRCPYLTLCNGECPKNRFCTTEDGHKGLNYLCQGLKRYFAHVLPYMEYMANELKAERPPMNIMRALNDGLIL